MFQHLSANYSFFNCLHTFSKRCLFFQNFTLKSKNCTHQMPHISSKIKHCIQNFTNTSQKQARVLRCKHLYFVGYIIYSTHSYSKPKVLLKLQFFSTAYIQNIYLSHNFCNLTLKHQIHTQNLQNHTLIIGLRGQVFNVIKHFLLNTTHNSLCNTQKSNRKCPFSNTTNQNTTLIHQCLTLTPHMCKHSLLYLTPINHGFRIVL